LGQVETKGLVSADGKTRITQGYQQFDTWPGPRATLSIQNCAAAPGERVTSDLVLTRPTNETNFGPSFLRLIVSYNASLLYAESLTNNATIVRWDYSADLDSTIIELQVPVPDQRALQQVLTTITFVAGLGNDSTSVLDLVRATPGAQNLGIELIDGRFTLLGICRSGGPRLLDVSAVPPLLEVRPNPVNTDARLRYRVADDGHVVITLHTLDGREARELLNAQVTAGDYEIPLPVIGLASGTYLLTMNTGTQLITAHVVVQL
jgi:hypothetical protein